MALRELPPQDVLRQFLTYDPETGLLHWLPRSAEHFKADGRNGSVHSMNIWNARFAGQEAFNIRRPSGHLTGSFMDGRYFAHRIIWKLMTGKDPGVIDHINGDSTDNRWSNLRVVSFVENNRNSGIPITNTTGFVGVGKSDKKGKPWRATITVGNKYVLLGYFETIELAKAARRGAERALGFSPDHGKRPTAVQLIKDRASRKF